MGIIQFQCVHTMVLSFLLECLSVHLFIYRKPEVSNVLYHLVDAQFLVNSCFTLQKHAHQLHIAVRLNFSIFKTRKFLAPIHTHFRHQCPLLIWSKLRKVILSYRRFFFTTRFGRLRLCFHPNILIFFQPLFDTSLELYIFWVKQIRISRFYQKHVRYSWNIKAKIGEW